MVAQDFQTSFAFVLQAEGGFAEIVGDHGGTTNYGITQGTYLEWLHRHGMQDAPVKDISQEYAEGVYLELYWQRGGCDKLVSPLNLVAFDACVNHGVGAAHSMLTSAIAFPGARVEEESFALLALRDNLYRRIVGRDPTQDKFLKGWLNRLEHLRTAAGL